MNSQFFRAALVLFCLGIAGARAELTWLTDYETAIKQGKDEGKLVLINFTGSDWCGWCIRLKSEVFDTPEFEAFARANLVLLEVDFPRRKAQTEQQRVINMTVQSKYPVEGYPTIIVAGERGRPMHVTGYIPGGPKAFIADIKKAPGAQWKAPEAGASVAGRTTPSATGGNGTASNEPLWNGTVFPPKRYDELRLTGLSGTASRRFAIVNNQTFTAGESARVKLKDGEVKVLCKEIRLKSAVVQVEGAAEPREIFLDGR